jgi:hypothetical protein
LIPLTSERRTRPRSAQGIACKLPDELVSIYWRRNPQERRGIEWPARNSAGLGSFRCPKRRMQELMSGGTVLTKDILFGMNVLTLVGFLVMGLSLTLHRTGSAGVPLSIGLMCAGTALVFFGFFAASSSN